ncbi:hypothetical protein ACFQ10_01220 [Streptomyces indonesiensis]
MPPAPAAASAPARPLPLFDHHIHSDMRNADDYELMAISGVLTALAPCSSSHEARTTGQAFAARFDRLLDAETGRAAAYGVDLYVGLSVHAADMTDLDSALAGVDELEKRLDHPRVKAIGEVSLRQLTREETAVLEAQLRLAARTGTPVMVETPPRPRRSPTCSRYWPGPSSAPASTPRSSRSWTWTSTSSVRSGQPDRWRSAADTDWRSRRARTPCSPCGRRSRTVR